MALPSILHTPVAPWCEWLKFEFKSLLFKSGNYTNHLKNWTGFSIYILLIRGQFVYRFCIYIAGALIEYNVPN